MLLTLVPVLPDGHCFYHALLRGLAARGLSAAAAPSIDASGRLGFGAAEVRAVKERLLSTLVRLGDDASLGDTARAALQVAMEGDGGSAPLLERLLSSRDDDDDDDGSGAARHFATEAEVMLAAAAYGVCVCVHQPDRLATYLPDLSVVDRLPESPAAAAVHLLWSGDHFDALDQA
jgi:hypothetical protein